MKNLQGKVAVITGAGFGIGAGIARAAAKANMRVIVADIELERAASVAGDIRRIGGEATATQVNVCNLGSMEALLATAKSTYGSTQLLCNCASVWIGALMQYADMKDWQRLIDVNLYGVIHGIKAFVPDMISQGEGHIVNTASFGGLIGGPPEGLYCTTKFAVVGLSEALLLEVAEQNIGVSILCHGLVKNDLISSSHHHPADLSNNAIHDESAPDTSKTVREPDDIGRRVIDGVKEGEFYIVTHAEYRQLVKFRSNRINEAIDSHAQKSRY